MHTLSHHDGVLRFSYAAGDGCRVHGLHDPVEAVLTLRVTAPGGRLLHEDNLPCDDAGALAAALAEWGEVPEPVRAEPPLVEEKRFPLPPLARPLAPTDTFGGPSRPLVRRAESVRPVEPAPAPVATTLAPETYAASLERQEQLATKMRELAEQRALVARKAAAVAVTDAAVAQSALAGNELRHDLRDPRSLRRAMVLREILGAPVALR
jgi:hypothetical protein